jgi:hypothetical protein
MSAAELQDELQQLALPDPDMTRKAASPYFSLTTFFTSIQNSSFAISDRGFMCVS